jgi:hypothetical protein
MDLTIDVGMRGSDGRAMQNRPGWEGYARKLVFSQALPGTVL